MSAVVFPSRLMTFGVRPFGEPVVDHLHIRSWRSGHEATPVPAPAAPEPLGGARHRTRVHREAATREAEFEQFGLPPTFISDFRPMVNGLQQAADSNGHLSVEQPGRQTD